jgi:hypothetical protein
MQIMRVKKSLKLIAAVADMPDRFARPTVEKSDTKNGDFWISNFKLKKTYI